VEGAHHLAEVLVHTTQVEIASSNTFEETITLPNLEMIVMGQDAAELPVRGSQESILDYLDKTIDPPEAVLIASVASINGSTLKKIRFCSKANEKILEVSAEMISLDLSDCGIRPVDLHVLGIVLPSVNKKLEHLNLSKNPLFQNWQKIRDTGDSSWNGHGYSSGDELAGFVALCHAFKSEALKASLRSVHMTDTGIGPKALGEFATVLAAGGSRIETIVLDRNVHMTNTRDKNSDAEDESEHDVTGLSGFCAALEASSVSNLSLCTCDLHGEALSALCHALSTYGSLQTIALDGNPIQKSNNSTDTAGEVGLSDFSNFCTALGTSHVSSVSIRGCYLRHTGLVALGKYMGSLTMLDISNNPSIMAERKGKTEQIDSHVDKIREFCGALSQVHLTCLNIGNIGMGPKGLAAFATAGLQCRSSNQETSIATTPDATATPPAASPLVIALHELSISDNQLFVGEASDIRKGWSAFVERLHHSPLSQLIMAGLGMGTEHLKMFASTVLVHGEFSRSIRTIDISRNRNIDPEGIKAMVDQYKAISDMQLQKIIIGPKATPIITCEANETELDYTGQELGPAEIRVIASFVLRKNPAVKKLDLAGNFCFSSRQELTIGKGFTLDRNLQMPDYMPDDEKGKKLPWLQNHRVDLNQNGWNEMCEAVCISTTIDCLILRDIGMGSDGLTHLGAGLKHLSATIRILDISQNACFYSSSEAGYSQKGWLAICEALQECHLQTLDVSDIGMEPKGLATFARRALVGALVGTLDSLSISQNKLFGSRTGKHIPNTQLHEKLHDPDQDQEGWSEFCDALASSKLTSLKSVDTGMGSVGLKTFIDNCLGKEAVLRQTPCMLRSTLKFLDLTGNPISDDGARDLIEIFDELEHLQTMLGINSDRVTEAHDKKTLDFSNCNLDSSNALLLAAELDSKRGSTGVLNVLNISRNTITRNGNRQAGERTGESNVYSLFSDLLVPPDARAH
jgi:hypothetical protein